MGINAIAQDLVPDGNASRSIGEDSLRILNIFLAGELNLKGTATTQIPFRLREYNGAFLIEYYDSDSSSWVKVIEVS